MGTYLAAGYCNCNEALFPLSTLSQQENSLEQREGGGGDGCHGELGVRPLSGHVVTISPVPEKILSGGVKINVYQLSLNHFSNPSHVSEQGNCGKQPYHAFNQISTFFSYVEVPLRWAALSHGGSLLQLCPKHRST